MAAVSGGGQMEEDRVEAHVGAHGAPNTAPACATTPMLADLGVL